MNEPLSPSSDGGARRPDGRFGPGNRYGRGCPVNRRMHALRRALVDAVEPERVAKVIDRLGELAEQGDVQAAKLLLEYAVGKPPRALELTGPDGEALGLGWERLTGAILGALAAIPRGQGGGGDDASWSGR